MAQLISKQTQDDIVRAGSTALAMGFSESLINWLAAMPAAATWLNTQTKRDVAQIVGGALILTSAKAGRVRGLARQASFYLGTGAIASGMYSQLSGFTRTLLQPAVLPGIAATATANGASVAGLGLYEQSSLSGLKGASLGRSMLQPMI